MPPLQQRGLGKQRLVKGEFKGIFKKDMFSVNLSFYHPIESSVKSSAKFGMLILFSKFEEAEFYAQTIQRPRELPSLMRNLTLWGSCTRVAGEGPDWCGHIPNDESLTLDDLPSCL